MDQKNKKKVINHKEVLNLKKRKEVKKSHLINLIKTQKL